MARGRTGGFVVAVALMVAAALPARATTAFVHADDFSWVPQEVTILPGDSVEWSNNDNVTHSVTYLECERAGGDDDPCLFNHDLDPGTVFQYAFGTPGLYEYECAIHLFAGRVRVLGPGTALPDLTFASLTSAPASATSPTTLRLSGTLKNLSAEAGSIRSDVLFQYRTGEGLWRTIGTSLANAVPAGGSTNVRILWDALGKAGDFEIRAIADGLNQVPETDETNNTAASATASVVLPPGTLSPGLDLTEGL